MRELTISVSEPWDFEACDGPNLLRTLHRGPLNGPDAENWQRHYLLLEVVHPFNIDGERVEWLVASPRFIEADLDSAEFMEGAVGLARVRPGVRLVAGDSFAAEDVSYCLVGCITPVAPAPADSA